MKLVCVAKLSFRIFKQSKDPISGSGNFQSNFYFHITFIYLNVYKRQSPGHGGSYIYLFMYLSFCIDHQLKPKFTWKLTRVIQTQTFWDCKYEEEEKFIWVGPVGGNLGGHIGGGGGIKEYNEDDGDLVDRMTVITIMIWWSWCKLLQNKDTRSMVTVIKSIKIMKYLWISIMSQIIIIIIINKQLFHIH